MDFKDLTHVSISACCAFMLCIVMAHAAVHDELPQCGLSGIYRTRQSVIESPNYPDNYPVSTCWDYVIRSPYRCPTKFHIQFLDFYLESSSNCTNDYLAIGLENDGDDMDVLCGQVIGIRKYHTPDGVLRLRFLSDDSPWTTGKGFKLLITRLACEREDLSRELNVEKENGNDDDDSVHVKAPPLPQELQPPNSQVPQLFRNFSLQEQHRPFGLPPVFGYPSQFQYQLPNQLAQQYPVLQLPQPPQVPQSPNGYYLPIGINPAFVTHPVPGRPPISNSNGQPQQQPPCPTEQTIVDQQKQQKPIPPLQQLPNLHQQQLPDISDQYHSTAFQPQPPTFKDYDPQSLKEVGPQAELCCSSSFRQQHFYLSSPGFPRTVFNALLPTQQRDCVFFLEKNSQNVCSLRVQFKFFDFGHNNQINEQLLQSTNYPLLNQLQTCTDDFIEIEGQRFCGCRSGYVYKSFWGLGKKSIRMRMGYGGVPSNGFLLEIHQDQDQNGCRDDAAVFNPNAGRFGVGLQPSTLGAFGHQSTNNGLYGFNYAPQPTTGFTVPQQQQQQPVYPVNAAQGGLLQQTGGYQHTLPTHPWQTYQPTYPLGLGNVGFGGLQLQPHYRNARRVDLARGINTHQPISVVETNSTRKEFYYYDGDEAFSRANVNANAANRADDRGEPDEPDDPDINNRLGTKAFEESNCSFDYMEVLKLTVDTLWLTKPICFAPLRSWFSNAFG